MCDFYLKSRFKMKKSIVYPILVSSLLFTPLNSFGGSMKSESSNIYEKAEKLYKDHNYKEAISNYEKLIKSSASESSKKQAYLKILECSIKIKQWDKAIDNFEKYQSLYDSDNLFNARILSWGAEIYKNVPHYGYKRNGKIYRDDSVRDGEYVYLDDKDREKAFELFEKSKEFYYKLKEDSSINKEVIELNFSMAEMLQNNYYYIYRDFESISKKIPNYIEDSNVDEKKRKLIVFLYDEIIKLNKVVKDSHYDSKALFKKASYFVNTYGAYKDFQSDKELKEYDPIPFLEQIVKNYKKDTLAPEALYGMVQIYLNRNNKVKALSLSEQLIKDYPQSVRVSDCKADIQEIKRKIININSLGVQQSGNKSKIELNTRNLNNVKIEVFNIDYLSKAKDSINNPNLYFNNFNSLFGGKSDDIKKFFKEKVTELKVEVKDKKDYQDVNTSIDLNVSKSGYYAVQVTSENETSIMPLIISDVMLIQNSDKDKVVNFLVNRETGKPIKGADITVKETYYQNNILFSGYKVKYKTSKTDNKGMFVYEKFKNDSSSSISVLAYKDKDITYSDAQYYGYYYQQAKAYKSYIYTDRPVYRPEQTVNFKQIIKQTENGDTKNIGKEKIKVVITAPNGSKVFEKELKTNEFGTINDSFKLEKGCPLGVYYFYTTFSNGTYITQSSGSAFRVEEYKKPEFIVNVNSDNSQARAGEKVKVKVDAEYYFGGKVANAKVTYKVMRNPYYYYYYRPSYYDWFYDFPSHNKIYENNYNSYGTVWKEGTLETDSEGNCYIEFETEKTTSDFKYDVEVSVVDSSRREIKGSTSVKVTQTAFFAFINFERGFYNKDENANIEINLRNPDEQPVEEEGLIKVYKVTYTGEKNDKEELSQVLSEKIKTDKKGLAFYKWKIKNEGYYKVVFETKDKYGAVVKGENSIWVNGENFNGKYYKFQNIELATDKRTYEEGETCHVMLSTNHFDSFVMLFNESSSGLLSNDTIFIPSKSKVYSFKITKQHIPNFNLKAITVKDNQLFMQNRELFVPPTNQFLNVSIKSNKETFLPREKAIFEVKTTDNKGKPISGEVSLGLTDSSIYYIQEDNTGDIKKFYYGDRNYIPNNLVSSLYLNLYGINETKTKEEYFKRHRNPFYFYNNMNDDESLKEEVGSSIPESAPMMDAVAPSPQRSKMAAPPSPAMAKEKKNGTPGGTPNFKDVSDNDIRSYFPDTAHWSPVVLTDKNGIAKVEVEFPDSLTTWRVNSLATDKTGKVGSSKQDVITKKDVLVRLQAPRFFMERDEIVLSGIVNNQTNENRNIRAIINTSSELENIDNSNQDFVIKANGEKRVDWRFKVKKEGTAKITLKALGEKDSDAVKLDFPVYVHGIDKNITQSGIIKDAKNQTIDINIPKEIKGDSASLKLTLSPSVITTVAEALPYLAEYPYGCVEQTTSRFIPTVTVAKTIKELGIDLKDIRKNPNFEKRKNSNPVYSEEKIDSMVKSGLNRLYKFQNSDGGFGWWSGFESDPYMSTYVLYGLNIAKEAKYNVDSNVLDKALSFVEARFKERTDDSLGYNRLYMAYVLSEQKRIKSDDLSYFFKKRDELNNYGKALLSLAYANIGEKDKADLICQNLKNEVLLDKENQTASWKSDFNWYWYWYGDRIETNTFILKAFLKSRPKDEIVPMSVKWLLQNRKSNHWYSTKDTANAIYALSEYASINKEADPDYKLSILYNNELVKKITVNKDNMLSFDNIIDIPSKYLESGKGKLTFVKEGKGSLYYNTSLDYFSLEEDIKGSGNQISVQREYFKVTESLDENKKIVYNKEPISYNQELKSGDIVEVKLSIKSNNDYEYLIFEDMKPAGFEATDLKSGYVYQNSAYMNKELRDEKVVFFLNNLHQGTQVITYKLRAEIPGKFHVMPHKSYAMYAPEVKAISDEMRIQVKD